MLKRVVTTSNFLCIFLFVVASTPVSIFVFQRPGKLEAISLEDLKKVEQSKCNCKCNQMCRTFHTAPSPIHILIPTVDYRSVIAIRIGIHECKQAVTCSVEMSMTIITLVSILSNLLIDVQFNGAFKALSLFLI